jgi:hypothetical protein
MQSTKALTGDDMSEGGLMVNVTVASAMNKLHVPFDIKDQAAVAILLLQRDRKRRQSADVMLLQSVTWRMSYSLKVSETGCPNFIGLVHGNLSCLLLNNHLWRPLQTEPTFVCLPACMLLPGQHSLVQFQSCHQLSQPMPFALLFLGCNRRLPIVPFCPFSK